MPSAGGAADLPPMFGETTRLRSQGMHEVRRQGLPPPTTYEKTECAGSTIGAYLYANGKMRMASIPGQLRSATLFKRITSKRTTK